MLVRLRRIQTRLSDSLFFVPMLFVVAAVVLGEAMLVVDAQVGEVPHRLTATVESARAVLTVVGGATLSFAGIAFSVSVLLISLASSQYSPRVIHGLFRDPFNKRIMGIVIGTFTYCLVVLRAVRGPLEDSGQAVVPSLSILVALALGVVSVLSIVAFISHSAHSMDVSRILQRVTAEALASVRGNWRESEGQSDGEPTEVPTGIGFVVTFETDGWVQHVDVQALLKGLEPGACLRMATVAGRFAVPGTEAGTIWPMPYDPEAARRMVLKALILGETRVMQQDAVYGVRQLADVALKALSPGVNDPTTAQDALFHLGAVVREMLVRLPPPREEMGEEGRRVLLPELPTHEEVVEMAFDEIRVASAGQPTVQIYFLEILHLLTRSLDDHPRPEAVAALRRQADLAVATGELSNLTEYDHQRVRLAHQRRFVEASR
ncbi:MAG: DUF2254 domain-containing protein [Dehalococcoidia bacterium]